VVQLCLHFAPENFQQFQCEEELSVSLSEQKFLLTDLECSFFHI